MLKVLLLAYACEPNKGSEPGVGWNSAIHLSKYVNVIVVTRANNRTVIEAELKNKIISSLSFIYFDIRILSKIKKVIPFGVQLYYLIWEFFVINKIKHLKIDLIQRVTFVSTVTLLRLYKLNVPYILSFCAGGETSPKAIYNKYSFIDKIKESIRKSYNSLCKYCTSIKRIYNESKLVLAVTSDVMLQGKSYI